MPQPVTIQLGPFKGGLVHTGARDLYFVKPDEAQTASNVELENGGIYGAWQPGATIATFSGDAKNTVFNVANTWAGAGSQYSVLKIGDTVYAVNRSTAAQPLVWANSVTSKQLGIVPPVATLEPANAAEIAAFVAHSLAARETATTILAGEEIVVTFKQADGTESNASNVLVVVGTTVAKIEYTNPSVAAPWNLCQDIVGGRIWRTNGGAAAVGTGKYYLVASFSLTELNWPIYLGATRVLIGGISAPAVPNVNISLAWDPGGYPNLGEGSGRAVDTQYIADHSYPPLLTVLADKLHSAFHGGDPTAGYLLGANGRWLYWSEGGNPAYFPTRNKVEFGDTIVAIIGMPGASVIFTPSGTYQFTISGAMPAITEFESGYYIRSDAANSVVWTPDGILYLAREGIARFNGQRSELLSQAHLDSTVLASWVVNAAAYDDGRYLLFLSTGTMVADLRFGLEGLRFSWLDAIYKAVWTHAGSLYVLGSDGVSLYKWENGRGVAYSSSFSGTTSNTGVSIASVTGATASGVYDLSLITTQSVTELTTRTATKDSPGNTRTGSVTIANGAEVGTYPLDLAVTSTPSAARTPAWSTAAIPGVALAGISDGADLGTSNLALTITAGLQTSEASLTLHGSLSPNAYAGEGWILRVYRHSTDPDAFNVRISHPDFPVVVGQNQVPWSGTTGFTDGVQWWESSFTLSWISGDPTIYGGAGSYVTLRRGDRPRDAIPAGNGVEIPFTTVATEGGAFAESRTIVFLPVSPPTYSLSWAGGAPQTISWGAPDGIALPGPAGGSAGTLTINTSGTAPTQGASASVTVSATSTTWAFAFTWRLVAVTTLTGWSNGSPVTVGELSFTLDGSAPAAGNYSDLVTIVANTSMTTKYQWKWYNTLFPESTPYANWSTTSKTITDPIAGIVTFTPGDTAPSHSDTPRVDPITVTFTAADRSGWAWRTPPLNPGAYTRWRRMRVVYQDQVKVRRIGYDGVLTTSYDIKTLQSATRKDELLWLPPSTPGAWQAFEFIGENYSVTGRVGSLVRCQLYGEQFDGGS